MPRVKRGVPAHARHKRILKFTKGQQGTKHLLPRRANEARMKSLWYMYRDRRRRKGEFRRLWITRINAAARLCGLTYHDLIAGLSKAKVDVDRKILADLAVTDSATFAKLVEVAKQSMAA